MLGTHPKMFQPKKKSKKNLLSENKKLKLPYKKIKMKGRKRSKEFQSKAKVTSKENLKMEAASGSRVKTDFLSHRKLLIHKTASLLLVQVT